MRAIQLSTLAALVLAAFASGCEGDSTGTEPTEAPDFEDGQGQEAKYAPVLYPVGPYGLEVGSVIENFQFVGYPNAALEQGELRSMQLADFYNPTGDEVYPEGSLHGAGEPKPTVIMLVVSAVWCGPCNYEADAILPGEHEEYSPRGAEFLLVLADGPTPGITATFNHLKNWTTKYDTNWPSAIDPSYKLSALFVQQAFPQNMLIDTKTMKIVEVIAGVPEAGSSFFDTLEAHLKN